MKKVIFVILCIAAAYFHFQYRGKIGQGAMQNAKVAALIERYAVGDIDLADLPLQQAIKQVNGKGTHVLVTFEDPNCPYCSELDQKISQLDDVTLYTFLLPILSEDSRIKSNRIWCANDRAAAWNDWMLRYREPAPTRPCDTTAITKNLQIGKKLGIQGVPYLLQAKQSS